MRSRILLEPSIEETGGVIPQHRRPLSPYLQPEPIASPPGQEEVPLLVLDPQGRVVACNQACELALDHPLERVQGMALWDLISNPATAEALRTIWHYLPAPLPAFQLGHLRWAAHPALESDGRIACVICRQATQTTAIDGYRDLFREILHSLPLGVLLHGPDTEILLGNAAALELLGLSESELLGKTCYDPAWNIIAEDGSLFSPDMLPVVQSCQHRQPLRKVVMGVYRPRVGDRVWLVVDTTPLLQSDGSVGHVIASFSDITPLKQAQEDLRESEGRFGIAFRASPIPSSISTLAEGRYIDVNDSFLELWDLSRQEVIGRTSLELNLWAAPADRTQIKQQLLQHGSLSNIEVRYRLSDGEIRDGLASFELIEIEAEPCILSLFLDITDRKRAEESLRLQANRETQLLQRERLVRAIAQNIRRSLDLNQILQTTATEVRRFLHSDRVAICQIRADGNGIFIAEDRNDRWPTVLGSRLPEAFWQQQLQVCRQGLTIADGETGLSAALSQQWQIRALLIVPIFQLEQLWGILTVHHCSQPRTWQPEEIALLEQLSTQIGIAIQQAELYQQVQLLNAELEYQVEVRTAQLQQVLTFEALLKRITDRVRDSLDETQILQTGVAELAQGLEVLCCDTAVYDLSLGTATIRYEHTQMPSTLGLTIQMSDYPDTYAQLLRGESFQHCVIPCSRRGLLALLSCPILDERGGVGDLTLFRPSEETFTDLEVRLVQQVANQCAIAIRQARLYQALQQQVLELAHLNQLKDDFLSTVSHELRTPITNMKMALHLLQLSASPERQAHYLRILRSECEREGELINDLLDLQRLEARAADFTPEEVKLLHWLPPLLDPFLSRAHQIPLHVFLEWPLHLPTLHTDPRHLRRILTEMLNNACKYTAAHGTVDLIVRATATRIQFYIRNSTQISSHELPHIFQKFYRIPSQDPWKQGGTGLGLALVERLVTELGGSVQAESSSGFTTFTIDLPLQFVAPGTRQGSTSSQLFESP